MFTFLTPDEKTVTVIVNEGEEREITLDGSFTEMKIVQSVDEDYLNEIYDGEYKEKITVKSNSILTVICK